MKISRKKNQDNKAGAIGLRLKFMQAGSLAPNKRNWRRHGPQQLAAISALLADPAVGWAGALLFNERTGRLVDGHARLKAVAPNAMVPVLCGRWDEAAEARILATLDTVDAFTEIDPQALKALLADVSLDGDLAALAEDLNDLLGDSAPTAPEDPAPATVAENVARIAQLAAQHRESNKAVAADHDTERFLIVVFGSREARERAVLRLGLPKDERYVAAETVRLRPSGVRGAPSGFSAGPVSKTGACG